MATEPSLRTEVRDLRAAVVGLTDLLDSKVEERVAEVSVPREEFNRRIRRSGQRVALALVAVVALAAFLVAFNRATLQQAQRQAEQDLRRLITVCRVTTPTISPADLAFCSGRIPNFSEARANAARQAATARRLENLQEWAKGKGWRPPK